MQRLGASQGVSWISEAWRLMRGRMGLIIGVVFLMYVLLFVASMVPFIGNVVVILASPFLAGGVYVILKRVREIQARSALEPLAAEQPISWDLLFSVFQDPTPRKSLLGFALISVGFQLVMLLIFAAYITVALSGIDHSVLTDPNATDKQRVELLLPLLMSPSAGILWIVVTIAAVLYSMATFFAVPLIVLEGQRLWPAFRQSFAAVTANWVPFLVYGLIWMVLFVTIPFTLGLSLIILLPLTIVSVFVAFEAIWPTGSFGQKDLDASGGQKMHTPQERASSVM